MSHSDERELERVWEEFATEARTLLAIEPEDMTPEQRERFETISDAFIHLVGYARSREPFAVERDPRLRDELARWQRLRRAKSARKPADDRGEVFTDAQRLQLRQRILSGLQSRRLRLREVEGAPVRRRLAPARGVTPDLLKDLELVRRAVVVPDVSIAAGAGRELWNVECDSAIELPADLPHGPYIALKVTGDSMEPLLHSGDTVLVRVDDKATAGTVVVARDPDHGYVVKEVVRLTAEGMELRSLNPEYRPFVVPHAPATVLGTVVLRWCPHPQRHSVS